MTKIDVKLFDDIRGLFAETVEAKARGYDKGRFSFNVEGGRCEGLPVVLKIENVSYAPAATAAERRDRMDGAK